MSNALLTAQYGYGILACYIILIIAALVAIGCMVCDKIKKGEGK